MTDTIDDLESDAGRLFCRECKEHFEDCECKLSKRKWEIHDLVFFILL